MTRLELLTQSRDAAREHDWHTALAKLNAAWTTVKSAEFSELAWAMVGRAAAPGVTQKRERDTEATWLAEAGDEGLGAILARVSTPWPRLVSDAQARVKALTELAKPHVLWTAYLSALVRADPYQSNASGRLLRKAVGWLRAAEDQAATRLALELELIQASDLGGKRWPKQVPLAPDEAELVEAIRAAAGRPGGDLSALFEAVYAQPDDDAPRLVLADALTERGDPRGEFISLQLAAANARNTRRLNELLRTHQDEWLGPLAPFIVVPKGMRARDEAPLFVRGFPHAVTVASEQPASIFSKTAAWGTVERLEVSDFEFHPHLRALRALIGVRNAGQVPVPALARAALHAPSVAAPMPFTSVAELGLFAGWQERAQLLPALERLWKEPWFPTVRTLVLPGTGRDEPFAREMLEKVPSIDEVVVTSSMMGSSVSAPATWELRRARSGTLRLTWQGRNYSAQPPEELAAALTGARVAGLRAVVIDNVQAFASGQQEKVHAAILEAAQGWPAGVALTLFGEPVQR